VIKLAAFLTVAAALPSLGGLLLIGKLENLPVAATVVVVNSLIFRGTCGILGGILLWRGSRWGYYLSLIAWLYLVTLSLLTLWDLHGKGLVLSLSFLQESYSAFGRPFARSLIQVVLGLPIIYVIFKDLGRRRNSERPLR
jgi:ABC-type multidrug transport system permease subunit